MSDPGSGPARRDPMDRPRLERAPGERYAVTADPARRVQGASEPAEVPGGGVLRAVAAAAVAAAAGALVFFGLGLLDLGAGQLAAAAAIGWVVALALIWGGKGEPGRAARTTLAGGLGAAAVLAGLLLVWAWSRTEGGVLDPVAYLDDRFGLLALADVLVAAAAGALRAR